MVLGSPPRRLLLLFVSLWLYQWILCSCAWNGATAPGRGRRDRERRRGPGMAIMRSTAPVDTAGMIVRQEHHRGNASADPSSDHRRRLIAQFAVPVLIPLITLGVQRERAAATAGEAEQLHQAAPVPAATAAFVRQTSDFAYTFTPPPGFTSPSQKPIKTHLDEVNFKIDTDTNTNTYTNTAAQFGITVDPLRIGSLSEFGRPEQVAAKVVLAEVNRDGVFDVTLMEDPFAGGNNNNDNDDNLFYQLNYRSNGKRGVKRYVAKFYIRHQKLFALTAQCNEDAYEANKDDILKAVDSFKILPSL